MQQDIRTLKQISSVGMIVLCPHHIWVHAHLRTVCQSCPTPKLHGENVLNRQYLSGGLFDFAQIL